MVIVCNALLFAGKMAIGLVMGSIAVVADALNNLSDAASAVIGLVGIRLAEKPANRKHPFGYGRMEYIAAFIVAFLVIEVGLFLFRSSVSRRIDSKVMMAAAADSLGDSLSTGVTILSVLIFQVTGVDVDTWAGLVVSLFVMVAGVKIAKETLEPLLVPHDYDQEQRDAVEFDILRQINRMEGRYLCVITMDKSYVVDEGTEGD